MQLSAAQLAEHDEELEPVISAKGDIALYKINHKSKQVWIKTGENDGNEKQWRLTNGGYESLMQLIGRNSQGQPVGEVKLPKPQEVLDPFGRPTEPSDDA